jgi:5-methylcytosine-specific restriction protein A
MAWSKDSPDSRGYGWKWRKQRERILKRDCYICQCAGCRAADRTLEANEVYHIISKARWLETHTSFVGVDDDDNLQAINVDCHKLKTMLEKGVRPRFGCTTSGWPSDPDHPWNRR